MQIYSYQHKNKKKAPILNGGQNAGAEQRRAQKVIDIWRISGIDPLTIVGRGRLGVALPMCQPVL